MAKSRSISLDESQATAIRDAMAIQQITQIALAEKVGLSRSTIIKALGGEPVDRLTLVRIYHGLDMQAPQKEPGYEPLDEYYALKIREWADRHEPLYAICRFIRTNAPDSYNVAISVIAACWNCSYDQVKTAWDECYSY
jgi:transcriptional regulator with XRE-family HTH domain